MAELINQTLVIVARASLHHAKLGDTFWEDAIRDFAFNYNIMTHSALDISPHRLWNGAPTQRTGLFTFGQLGIIPIYGLKIKIFPRADPARYMFAQTLTEIIVFNLRTLHYQRLQC